jgi:outer membrane protein
MMAPLDEKQAESQLADSMANLLRARQSLSAAENVLKNLIVKDFPEWKDVTPMPSEALVVVPEIFDVQESWRNGLIKRPDLAQLRVNLERLDIDIKFRKNQRLPDLNLVGGYGQNAINTGGEKVFWGVNKSDSSFYYYGVQLSFPWGNRDAKYRYRLAQDQRIQAEIEVQQLQQAIMVQIDDAISNAKVSYDVIPLRRQAREFAEAALDAEQKKFQNGKSTSFIVLQLQRDLTTARGNELLALTAYNKAVANVARADGTALDKVKINIEIK